MIKLIENWLNDANTNLCDIAGYKIDIRQTKFTSLCLSDHLKYVVHNDLCLNKVFNCIFKYLKYSKYRTIPI